MYDTFIRTLDTEQKRVDTKGVLFVKLTYLMFNG